MSMLDFVLHMFGAELVRSVFHSVSRNDEDSVLGNVLLARIAMDSDNVLDCPADCIQQRGAAPCRIIFFRHGRDVGNRKTIVDHLALVVEDIGSNEDFALTVVVLLQNAVETPDGVVGQMSHGSAHIEDEYQFCEIFFHFSIRNMLFRDHEQSISQKETEKVKRHLTYLFLRTVYHEIES